jgi:hypothetical protein
MRDTSLTYPELEQLPSRLLLSGAPACLEPLSAVCEVEDFVAAKLPEAPDPSSIIFAGWTDCVAGLRQTCNLTASDTISADQLWADGGLGVDFSYDSETRTATWDFNAQTYDPGWYRITLSAAGVTDAAGNALDGDGNGTGGDDYIYGDDAGSEDDLLIPILGDTDLDGDVDYTDYMTTMGNYGQPSGMEWDDGDFDYDGDVDWLDYLAVKSHYGQSLSRP